MFSSILLLATATVGISVGWEPLPNGGTKYLIQIDADSLDGLRAGIPLESDIQNEVPDVRAFKILYGTGMLPQKLPPKIEPKPQPKQEADSKTKPEADEKKSEPDSQEKNPEPSKPWMTLTIVSLLLFASLGGNVFLLWIFAELRKKYRASLSKDSPDFEESLSEEPEDEELDESERKKPRK